MGRFTDMKKIHPLLSVLFLIYWGCENIAIPKSQEDYRNSLFALKSKYKSSDTSAKQMKVIKEREAFDKKNDAMFMDSWVGKITNVYNSFIVCEYDGIEYNLTPIGYRDNTIYNKGQKIIFSGFVKHSDKRSIEFDDFSLSIDCISIMSLDSKNNLFKPKENEIKSLITKVEKRIGKNSIWRVEDKNPLLKEMLSILNNLLYLFF